MNLNEVKHLIHQAEDSLQNEFSALEEIALYNQEKVLKAFQAQQIAVRHFNGTSGYGNSDDGKEAFGRVLAQSFGAESCVFSPSIASGTHALTLALFGILRPGDKVLSISGEPYDTMQDVIYRKGIGSLADYQIEFECIDLCEGRFRQTEIASKLATGAYRMVYIQRSRGYSWRKALSLEQIEDIVPVIKELSPNTIIFVDNCYGEFTQKKEPCDVGADLVAGSLIKNPGGGIAPTGGYIAGRQDLVELVSYRLTVPSIGSEIGSYTAGYRAFYQGLFLAPHVVMQAMKGAKLFSEIFRTIGYEALPASGESLNDIVCSVRLQDRDKMIAFCQALQAASPIDSNVCPCPWSMPGYADEVIMAAGCFVEGASIELSCDAPLREPYILYLQGGLTYEHIKIAAQKCLESL